jgi:glycosyltransferase involved in cell wall biosynthesis
MRIFDFCQESRVYFDSVSREISRTRMAKTNPIVKISVITACRNSEGLIGSALQSVARQTWPDVEHIVVDGASTDGTLAIIREATAHSGGRVRWISEPDSGFYDALNKGIRLATGDVVGILNADDFFADETILAEVARTFSDAPIDCVFGDIRFVRQSNLEKTVRYCSGRSFRPWMLRFGFMPPHPSFFARRNLFARLGYYKTDYRIAADFELLVRFLWINRIRSKYLALATTKMRLGGMSTRSPHSTWILNREQVRACRENGRFTTLPVLSFKYLFKVFELVYTRNP